MYSSARIARWLRCSLSSIFSHSAIVFSGPLGLSNQYVSITSNLEKSADHIKLIVDNNIKNSKVKKVIDFNALIKQAQYWENNLAVYNLKLI